MGGEGSESAGGRITSHLFLLSHFSHFTRCLDGLTATEAPSPSPTFVTGMMDRDGDSGFYKEKLIFHRVAPIISSISSQLQVCRKSYYLSIIPFFCPTSSLPCRILVKTEVGERMSNGDSVEALEPGKEDLSASFRASSLG